MSKPLCRTPFLFDHKELPPSFSHLFSPLNFPKLETDVLSTGKATRCSARLSSFDLRAFVNLQHSSSLSEPEPEPEDGDQSSHSIIDSEVSGDWVMELRKEASGDIR